MFDLSGKLALVTGASGGIGGAIARALHAQGASLVLSGTRAGALEALRAELGNRAYAVPCDLAQPEAVDGLVGAAEAAAGGELSILVANAGVTRDGLLLRMKDSDWTEVMRVNLESYFRLARAAVRGMMRRRSGRIIGITSVVGVMGNAGQANYAASKAGMIGFSKALAHEVASRGITVNCVAPGFIESPMTESLSEEQRARILGQIPLARLGAGADVAAACVFLASDEAAYVTGQTLHVNGGMAMV
ncbi:MAG TPA: 3-oxoacyl-[acyl-carrier-protein] reductase [Caulobacteraceae bacterium]|nr:3-oxoacyl-[acyl-carrier-protein] reductase [Caulobacteraceae bacterium]